MALMHLHPLYHHKTLQELSQSEMHFGLIFYPDELSPSISRQISKMVYFWSD